MMARWLAPAALVATVLAEQCMLLTCEGGVRLQWNATPAHGGSAVSLRLVSETPAWLALGWAPRGSGAGA